MLIAKCKPQLRKKPIMVYCFFFILIYVYKCHQQVFGSGDQNIEQLVFNETVENIRVLFKRMPDLEDMEIKQEIYDIIEESKTIPGPWVQIPKQLDAPPCPEPSPPSSSILHNLFPLMFNFNYVNKNTETINLDSLYPLVAKGGHYRPLDCKATSKVAIMVPIRDREENLRVFLYNIHPFLMRQNLEYRIFVVEQIKDKYNKEFNKGRLFNAGFLEIEKMGGWQCVVFHDVDLLPTDNRIRYSCPSLPRHMCSFVIEQTKNSMFGGVTAMNMWQYRLVNGYSNLYWRWGAEDDDIFYRIEAAGVGAFRYSQKIGRYTKLSHRPSPRNPSRWRLLNDAVKRYNNDGLSNIQYKMLNLTLHHLYTRFLMNINPNNRTIPPFISNLILTPTS